jgi:hypothetical protein
MSLKQIYVCDNCGKRGDDEPTVRIGTSDNAVQLQGQVNMTRWGIYVYTRLKRESQYGQEAHLCSARCLVLWLGLRPEDVVKHGE